MTAKSDEKTISLNWAEVHRILLAEFRARGYDVASVTPDVKVRVTGAAPAAPLSVFDSLFGESDRVKLARLKEGDKAKPVQTAEVHSFRVHIAVSGEPKAGA